MTIQDNPKYRVLLVDDEKEQLDKIKAIIERSTSLKKFIESIDPFLVDQQRGTEEIANRIKENPAHWNLILSDLFMSTNEGKGSLGGLLIADALIPLWESDPKFPVKLIIISNKGGAGGKLWEYSPRYDKWIYWYPKPSITSNDFARNDLPLPNWYHAIEEAIVNFNQDAIEKPIAEEILEIGLSGSMRITKTFADMVSKNKDSVLILGETGTGKDALAKYIHNKLFGKEAPFIPFHCQNVPQESLASELFGVVPNYPGYHHKEGKIGKFDLANTGTIFLNEIGKIKDNYGKLIQVLDPKDRKFEPLGAKALKIFKGKIICAASEPLDEWVKKDQFPREFYERISYGGLIKLTPLRERKEDIIPLANYFINMYSKEFTVDKKKLSEEAINLLEKYDWPGNVRELDGVVKEAMSNPVEGDLIPGDFGRILGKVMKDSRNCATELPGTNLSILPPDKFVKEIKGKQLTTLINETGLNESTIVEKIKDGLMIHLNNVGGNVSRVAGALGWSNRYFYQFIKRFGLKYSKKKGFYSSMEKQ